MCGIIGYISKTNKTKTGEKIIEQYQRQFERGQKGFGLIEISKGKTTIHRSTEPTKALLDLRFSTAPINIFHHRQPTSTDNEIEQTHPIFVSHPELTYNYFIIHNGIIHNEKELFKKHTEELGYVYTTYEKDEKETYYTKVIYTTEKFNDSESFAIELARYIEHKTTELNIRGSAAFMAVQTNKQTGITQNIYWGKNEGNPLEMIETTQGLLIASKIKNPNKTTVTDNIIYKLPLEKTTTKEITTELIASPLKFKKEEKTLYLPQTTKPTQTTNVKYNTHRNQSYDFKNTHEKEYDYDDYEPTYYVSEREEAFGKMADRVIEQIYPIIEETFYQMAYDELDDKDIEEVKEQIAQIIQEKNKTAKEKIRPFFDKKETKIEDNAIKNKRIYEELGLS